MPDRLSRARTVARETLTAFGKQISGVTTRILAGTGAVILLLTGIGIALAIHSASDTIGEAGVAVSDPPRDVVRPVRVQDFRFPRMHLEGPEGDFFRYRDPASAWGEEEIERLWLDLEPVAVDIVREENSELLEELLRMHP